MLDYIKRLITPDMVSLWVPAGQNGARDLIRGNHGTTFGTHPNVPVISEPSGPELITNGTFDVDTTGWSGENSVALSVVTGGQVGNCMKVLENGGNNPQAKRLILGIEAEKAYEFVFYHKDIDSTSNNPQWRVYDKSNATDIKAWTTATASATWTRVAYTFRAPADCVQIQIYCRHSALNGDGDAYYFDSISLKEVKPALINPSVGWWFGENDYVQLPENKSLDITGEMAVGAWVFPTEMPGEKGRVVLATWDYDSPAPLMRGFTFGNQSVGDNLFLKLYDSSGNFSSAGAVNFYSENLYKWAFIVGVFKPSQYVYFYLNNVKVGEDTTDVIAVQANKPGVPMRMGERADAVAPVAPWKDYIALPFVAKGAWSEAQVKNFGNATKSLFSPRGF